MRKTRFLISSLVAAGVTPAPAAHATPTGLGPSTGGPDPDMTPIVKRFAQEHGFILAGHRSHSSHASHSSHQSGSTGVVRYPNVDTTPRLPRTTPAPTPRASLPQTLLSPPVRSLPTRSQIESVVCQVQTGLKAYGYYDGATDCILGASMREALKRFQADFNLKVTGTITPEVLDTFRIVAG